MAKRFSLVQKRVAVAKAITWDGCHKIYVLMDDAEVKLMRTYGYDLIMAKDASPQEMLALLKSWYKDSCSLRFIDAVSTNEKNPNAGFETLIGQGE